MPDLVTLPLFPLNSVLFPQGRMSLRVFEARYMDMIGACMKLETSFGICLIAQGSEVGAVAIPHEVGVEARIVDWDMSQPGILGITVVGGRRFRIVERTVSDQGVVMGTVKWFEEPSLLQISAAHRAVLPLLHLVLADAGEEKIPRPHKLDDANWVGFRYAEFLPIPKLARQRLLELEDADLRLTIVHKYLVEHRLIKGG